MSAFGVNQNLPCCGRPGVPAGALGERSATRDAARLRYQARVADELSPALRATRLLIVDSQPATAGGVRVRGISSAAAVRTASSRSPASWAARQPRRETPRRSERTGTGAVPNPACRPDRRLPPAHHQRRQDLHPPAGATRHSSSTGFAAGSSTATTRDRSASSPLRCQFHRYRPVAREGVAFPRYEKGPANQGFLIRRRGSEELPVGTSCRNRTRLRGSRG